MPISIIPAPFNAHSPGLIGDVTPDVVTATVLTAKTGDLVLRSSGGIDKILILASATDIQVPGGLRLDSGRIYTGADATDISFNDGKQIMKASGTINIANVPISSSGLVRGDIYSNSGILTIVP